MLKAFLLILSGLFAGVGIIALLVDGLRSPAIPLFAMSYVAYRMLKAASDKQFFLETVDVAALPENGSKEVANWFDDQLEIFVGTLAVLGYAALTLDPVFFGTAVVIYLIASYCGYRAKREEVAYFTYYGAHF